MRRHGHGYGCNLGSGVDHNEGMHCPGALGKDTDKRSSSEAKKISVVNGIKLGAKSVDRKTLALSKVTFLVDLCKMARSRQPLYNILRSCVDRCTMLPPQEESGMHNRARLTTLDAHKSCEYCIHNAGRLLAGV